MSDLLPSSMPVKVYPSLNGRDATVAQLETRTARMNWAAQLNETDSPRAPPAAATQADPATAPIGSGFPMNWNESTSRQHAASLWRWCLACGG